jgi:hypothetical protein
MLISRPQLAFKKAEILHRDINKNNMIRCSLIESSPTNSTRRISELQESYRTVR